MGPGEEEVQSDTVAAQAQRPQKCPRTKCESDKCMKYAVQTPLRAFEYVKGPNGVKCIVYSN